MLIDIDIGAEYVQITLQLVRGVVVLRMRNSAHLYRLHYQYPGHISTKLLA